MGRYPPEFIPSTPLTNKPERKIAPALHLIWFIPTLVGGLIAVINILGNNVKPPYP